MKEFQNKANSQCEMNYDANGNLIMDLNRDIVTIKYNLLNLPAYIQFKNGNTIINMYNADGQKISSEFYTTLTTITSLTPGQVLDPRINASNYRFSGKFYIDNKELASIPTSSMLPPDMFKPFLHISIR